MTFGPSSFTVASHPSLHRLVHRKFPFELPPFEIYRRIQRFSERSFILDSVVGPEKLAEYSFIGFDPALTFKVKDCLLEVKNREGSVVEQRRVEEPLTELRRLISSIHVHDGLSRFVGGAVGYISYDSIRYWEKIPRTTVDSLIYPDIEMGIFNDGLIFDHTRREAHYFHTGEDRFDDVLELTQSKVDSEDLESDEPRANVSRSHFEDSVLKAKEYIASGDIFQVVLSRRLDFRIDSGLLSFYKSLMEINPSPYMYFLKMGERTIVGSSPEMLVRVEKGRVETFPIAGTRPRVQDESENRRLTEELLADPKDRAEHVMLVDLARNDLGRISKYGSVEVLELMDVHQYSHVQHLVSRVIGELTKGYDCYDTLRSVFPAGTVSGAPKVRAMEIIEELEPDRRGPYAGAVGYFSFNGNSDFAITIRTLTADRDRASIQVGAGIVADSVPEKEWLETEQKAGALLKALNKF